MSCVFARRLTTGYGDISWPPRSPDLSGSLRLFAWAGYLRAKEYETPCLKTAHLGAH
jgi:hypothetical protein